MDPFSTLGVDRRFDLDLLALEKTHRELSRALHPDKFVAAAPSERRAALEKAVVVNESWRTLRDPIRRAEALFALAGIAVGEKSEPKPSAEFLMEVMERREELAEARANRDMAAAHRMAEQIRARAGEAEGALAAGFGAGATRDALTALVPRLGELRFYRRFLDEVSAIEDEAG
jgi:molecular chaperone HscB